MTLQIKNSLKDFFLKRRTTLIFATLFFVFFSLSSYSSFGINKGGNTKDDMNKRWSEAKVNQWYSKQTWPVGVNYVVSSAINQIEMWGKDTFDPIIIDRELGWAEELGFNTVRIFLHDLVWDADPSGFKKRLDEFLCICEKHHMKSVVTFFTNGGTGLEPKLGKQPEEIQGVHNSGWVQSPGTSVVNDPTKWGRLERYIKDVLSSFKNDQRILMWCLYNEPENLKKGANSLPLLREVFKWARSVNPSQPLSSPIWTLPGAKGTSLDIVSFIGENCDVMTFHCYSDAKDMESFIKLLKPFNRPIICQEYMGRPKSTFEEILPILKRENVGAISWGLTEGKCNFYLPWGHKPGGPEPKVWFHDILNADGTPYSIEEVNFIKEITKKK